MCVVGRAWVGVDPEIFSCGAYLKLHDITPNSKGAFEVFWGHGTHFRQRAWGKTCIELGPSTDIYFQSWVGPKYALA